jgi:gliding motility-associated-like protein
LVAYDGNGVSDSIAKLMFITVFENPIVDAGNNQTSCDGDSVIINASVMGGTPLYTYLWSSGLGSGSSHTVAPQTTTTYYVSLTDANGCTSSDSTTITVGNYPIVLFDFDTLYSACLPSCISFTNQSTIASGSISQYTWSFGDGNTSTQTNPVYCYSSPGIYSVSLTAVSNLGCTANYSNPILINIAPQVIAAFTVNGTNPFKPNTPINITDNSSGGDILYYILSNGDTIMDVNPVLNFKEDGVYNICQVVRNSLRGCEDSTCMQIEVIGELIIPNVFTPNGDGNNDIFFIRGLYGKNNKIEIYTRWGQLIYYNETYGNDWDGRTSAGLQVSAGTYYFILVTNDGKEYTGSFMLIR